MEERGEMKKLVLLRHGESEWNRKNLFTGWTDVDLTKKGREEARSAGLHLRRAGFVFDLAFTSVLRRAIGTLWIVLDVMDLMWIPTNTSWRLNERHYGALQGLDKAETAQRFGEEQVRLWRRSYDLAPPALERTDERYPGVDPRYQHLGEGEIPVTESLRDTVVRLLPCWRNEISPALGAGKRVLICAHGNSLRALVKYLDSISDDEIVNFSIPTGIPLVYELDGDLRPLRSYYLADGDQTGMLQK